MGSQFVDLDADGYTDYLTATFDGSVHVAYGSDVGFAAPTHLLDAGGQRIILDYYWDHDKNQHLTDGRAMPGGEVRTERLISALAWDWDGDGDRDLLLGSYENGALYRQMNEGSDAEPKYTGVNIPVMAGGEPWVIPAKMTAPQLVDWDGDGDMDLVTGSFEGEGAGGAVYLSLNDGEPGAPRFGALQTLIAPSPLGWQERTRPDRGLYPAVLDYDGDGDLDLVVGGYAVWTPPAPELTAEQQARIVEAEAEQARLMAAQEQIYNRIGARIEELAEGLEPGTEAYQEKITAAYAEFQEELDASRARLSPLFMELRELKPGPTTEGGIWLYEGIGQP